MPKKQAQKTYGTAGATRASFPRNVKPALAKLISEPFNDPNYFFEMKFDGVRIVAYKKGRDVELYSRNGNNLNDIFPEIVLAVSKLKSKNLVLDGEVVAVRKSKILGFQEIQPRLGVGNVEEIEELVLSHPVVFFVFDFLYADGWDVTHVPFETRKSLLKKLIPNKGGVQFVPAFPKFGKKLFALLTKQGFEGIIAKEKSGMYVQGARIWQKAKSTHQQEFIICGWTEGQGARAGVFGALILGAFDPATKKLVHMGNVGTGFNESMLLDLMKKFRPLEVKEAPFQDFYSPTKKHWMKLRMVAEIRFAEITHDLKLRKPVFLGLRIDKKPKDVVIERPQ